MSGGRSVSFALFGAILLAWAPGALAQEGAAGADTTDVRAGAEWATPTAEGAYVAPAEGEEALPGFAAGAAAAQRDFERRLVEAIESDSLARWARALAARPHVAGTPGQDGTRDSVVLWLEGRGLEVAYDTFVVYLPYPLEISVERSAPDPMPLPLVEEPLAEDPYVGEDPFPAFNAYGAGGEAEAEVVYANYGLPDDYRVLEREGIEVAGRIVVARYGRSYRGIKALHAERHGAAALILYSDPRDDGFRRGDVYPDGPMRPPSGVQRGSVLNVTGDPSTPGWPSLPGAERLPAEEMPGVPGIPVVPLGYGAAEELLRGLEGPSAPADWQGSLPFHYRMGPGPVRARVAARVEEGEAAYRPIHNTVAVLRGSEWPDEWIVVGGHRDAWGPGALDNVSGTASVVAAARAFAALAAQGERPRRTVVFATWDAEEWGLIGSTEWVERHADHLGEWGVAYLNQDAVAGGRAFSASAAPVLKPLMRAAAGVVADSEGEGSVLDVWRARHEAAARGARTARGEGEARAARSGLPRPEVPVGDLGGGSDHKPFYQWMGVPSASYGFGGPSGIYHSAYDTPAWMERFGDPGYLSHTASARVTAVAVARLANADVVPYDFAAAGAQLERMLAELADEGPEVEAALPSALEAAARLRSAGEALEAAARARLDAGSGAGAGAGSAARERVAEANAALRRANAAFLSERPIPGDPLARQLLFVSDPANGYATLGLPTLRLALRERDRETFRDQLEELRQAIERAAEAVEAAGAALAEG